jgi:hypothetical protein
MDKLTLIKRNREKHRAVYDGGSFIRKVWEEPVLDKIREMVARLDKVVPGYVLSIGHFEPCVYMNVRKLEGTPASEFPHTDEFIKLIHTFCLNNIKQTWPYSHYDWALSNIIINGDTLAMCDWDNIAEYPHEAVIKKLDEDLESAFGERYRKVIHV